MQGIVTTRCHGQDLLIGSSIAPGTPWHDRSQRGAHRSYDGNVTKGRKNRGGLAAKRRRQRRDLYRRAEALRRYRELLATSPASDHHPSFAEVLDSVRRDPQFDVSQAFEDPEVGAVCRELKERFWLRQRIEKRIRRFREDPTLDLEVMLQRAFRRPLADDDWDLVDDVEAAMGPPPALK